MVKVADAGYVSTTILKSIEKPDQNDPGLSPGLPGSNNPLKEELFRDLNKLSAIHNVFELTESTDSSLKGRIVGWSRDVLLRLIRPFFKQQVDFNHTLMLTVKSLATENFALQSELGNHNILLHLGEKARLKPARPVLTVVANYPLLKGHSGGQRRVLELYGQLAKHAEIRFISLGFESGFSEIVPGLTEYCLSISPQHKKALEAETERIKCWPVDVTLERLHHLTPAFAKAIELSAETSDAIVAIHPYVYSVIKSVTDKPVWYEAQDIELDTKKAMYRNSPCSEELTHATRSIESSLCEDSQFVFCMTERDAFRMAELYQIPSEKIRVMPNGANTKRFAFCSLEERRKNKIKLGLDDTAVAIFIGSDWGPNLEAIDYILRAAEQAPEVAFLLIGSSSNSLDRSSMPGNVMPMGEVGEVVLSTVMEVADVALNAVTYGTGTNIKLLEYFASGVPVVSTAIGARGLGVAAGDHYVEADLLDLNSGIQKILKGDTAATEKRIREARQLIESNNDWEKISRIYRQYLRNSETHVNNRQAEGQKVG